MSGAEKAELLDKVASSGLPKRRALGELGVPRSTYYRWLRGFAPKVPVVPKVGILFLKSILVRNHLFGRQCDLFG